MRMGRKLGSPGEKLILWQLWMTMLLKAHPEPGPKIFYPSTLRFFYLYTIVGRGVWPGAAIRIVAAPQVAYLSARLGFTLRDAISDTIYPTL
jgi:hypothetical protein